MIRLCWRQFRAQAAVAVAALVLIAIGLVITGPHLVHLYNTAVANCKAKGDCQAVTSAFLNTDTLLQSGLSALLLVTPALIGIFWGAPLIARELETGSFRFAWTQSISRKRWLAAKLGLVGLASMIAAGLLSLMVSWWFSPLDRVTANRFSPALFGERGITPIGYAALAFALGVTAGMLLRRTLPAMATTLVAFVAARLAVTYRLRPHFIAPAHLNVALTSSNAIGMARTSAGLEILLAPPHLPNAWVYSEVVADNAGHPPTTQFLTSVWPSLATNLHHVGASYEFGAPGEGAGEGSSSSARGVANLGAERAFRDGVAKVGATFHEVVTYQPASRFWAFQAYETAIFVGLALISAGFCFWWVRNRLS